MWNQVLDNALRETAARWESEGIGFRLATDNRKAQKRRRGSSVEAAKDDGRVLHHLCWADDLYVMAGTMKIGHEMEREKSYHRCWAIRRVQTWGCC